jgi:hypothetical protein
MGGWPYQYVVPFQDDVQAALDALRTDVFARGAYYGSEARPRSIKEAVARSGESGTRSILDIERVSPRPDYRRAAPLTAAEVERYFGGAQPTMRMVEECDDLWENLERGQARYLVVYDGGVPINLVFVGYSFD